MVHVQKDIPVGIKEVDEARYITGKHMKALCNIYQPGASWGDQEETRTRRTMMEQITVIPPVVFHQKDHKPQKQGEPQAVRGICNATTTFNQRVTDLLNDQLEAMLKSDPTDECISTEDFLYNVDLMNQKMSSGDKKAPTIIGSLDVTNLYGSIDKRTAANLVRERALNSNMSWENIDYRWAMIYLALTLSNREIVDQKLQRLIPRRNSKSGKGKPTILTAYVDEKVERW